MNKLLFTAALYVLVDFFVLVLLMIFYHVGEGRIQVFWIIAFIGLSL